MSTAFLVRFRPTGPWRIGPESGDRDRVDRIFHSDSLYSAVCAAMARIGVLEEWIEATARRPEPAVRFSSCFPFLGDTLYVVPPSTLWPPPPSAKVRWKGARFVPLSLVESLLAGEPVRDDRWTVDGLSECLVPSGGAQTAGPFRAAVRTNAAVDRWTGETSPHSIACLEFTPSAGLWMIAAFSDAEARDRWAGPLTAALRLLADSGFGGKRSLGWGRSEMPEIAEGPLPDLIMKPVAGGNAWWLLSSFTPSPIDVIDWDRGAYSLATRGGRVESAAGWGAPKKITRMVTEGSVLISAQPPRGSVRDVAPDGFDHPVFRAGYALAIPLPGGGA